MVRDLVAWVLSFWSALCILQHAEVSVSWVTPIATCTVLTAVIYGQCLGTELLSKETEIVDVKLLVAVIDADNVVVVLRVTFPVTRYALWLSCRPTSPLSWLTASCSNSSITIIMCIRRIAPIIASSMVVESASSDLRLLVFTFLNIGHWRLSASTCSQRQRPAWPPWPLAGSLPSNYDHRLNIICCALHLQY